MGLEGDENDEPEDGATRTTEKGGRWKYDASKGKWVAQGFKEQQLKTVTIKGDESATVSLLDFRGLNWVDEVGNAAGDALLPRIDEKNVMDFNRRALNRNSSRGGQGNKQSEKSDDGYGPIIPTRFTIGGDFTGAYGPYGVAHSVKFNWLLKGKDASFWPYLTAETGPAIGYELGAEIVAGPQWYLLDRNKKPILQKRMSGSAFNLGGSLFPGSIEASYGMNRG
jgi:hypothetical protein